MSQELEKLIITILSAVILVVGLVVILSYNLIKWSLRREITNNDSNDGSDADSNDTAGE